MPTTILDGEGYQDALLRRYEEEHAANALREALAEQAEQEPVAWVDEDGFPWKYNLDGKDWVPLYAAPVRTKDLTDDELWALYKNTEHPIDIMRAVIAADREKNK